MSWRVSKILGRGSGVGGGSWVISTVSVSPSLANSGKRNRNHPAQSHPCKNCLAVSPIIAYLATCETKASSSKVQPESGNISF